MFPVLLLGTDEPEGHSCADRVLSLMAKKTNKTLFLSKVYHKVKEKHCSDKCSFF